MNTNDLHAATIHLHKGAILRVHGNPGQRIEALSGCLWITMDNDLRDIVVDAGQGFDVDRSADTLISALDESRFVLLDSPTAQRH